MFFGLVLISLITVPRLESASPDPCVQGAVLSPARTVVTTGIVTTVRAGGIQVVSRKRDTTFLSLSSGEAAVSGSLPEDKESNVRYYSCVVSTQAHARNKHKLNRQGSTHEPRWVS